MAYSRSSAIAVISPVLFEPMFAPRYCGECMSVTTGAYIVVAVSSVVSSLCITAPHPAGVDAVLCLLWKHEPSV